jgi:1-acyl-sn-glycerol-3-phosphate acyltransferase
LVSIGHDFRKGPMKNGCRKWIIFFMYHVGVSFYLFIAGMKTTLRYQDVDYSYYLGPEYKRKMKKIKRTSTIVSNHVSWLDPVVMLYNIRPAFAPSEEFKRVPLIGTLCDVIDSIYIPRGGSPEKRAQALAAIRDRQELIEQTGQYAPFLIFAEGGTTNGSCVLSLKKGAFFAEKTIRPMYLSYRASTIHPAFDVMEFLPLTILQMSWTCYKCDVTVMPDF